MAIAPPQFSSPEEILSDLPADFTQIMARTNETEIGFDSFEYDPDVHVVKREVLWPAREVRLNGSEQIGRVGLELYQMNDGTAYEVLKGVPLEPKTAVAVASRPALFTSIQGYNEHTLQQITALGFRTYLVGPEGGHRDGWIPRKPRGYTLAQSAHNLHEILDANNVETIVSEGKSWGAMVGLGVVDLADQHGRKVAYSEHVDPVGEIDWLGLLRNPKKLAEVLYRGRHELAAMAVVLGGLTVRRALHYAKSINPSPNFQLQSVRELFQITNGETLKLAARVPISARMHTQIFTDNLVSQGEEIQGILGHHPNVRLSPLHRGHLWIPSEDTDFGVEIRLGHLANELDSAHDNIDKVDFNNVHLDISTLNEAT